MYGTEYNSVREGLPLMPVTPGMKFIEGGVMDRYIFVNASEHDAIKPTFLHKVILLTADSLKLYREEDNYLNPVEKKYLIVTHIYYPKDSTTVVIQSINDNLASRSGGDSEYPVNYIEADSTLKSWKIKPNPIRKY